MNRKFLITLASSILSISAIAQSLSLDSCKTYALENNKKLKEAKLELQSAEQVKKGAFTKYFPTVNAAAVALKSNDYLLDMEIPGMNLPVYDGNPANLATANQFAYFPGMEIQAIDYVNTAMVTAIQPIYTGGRIINGNKLANLGIKANKDMINLSTDEVLVNTEFYYWTLVSLKEKKRTLISYQKLLENLSKDVDVAYKAGITEKSDVLKVQLKLNEVNSNMLKLENGIQLTTMALCQYIGVPYSEKIIFTDSLLSVETPEHFYKNTSEALNNRYEYQLLNKAVTAEELKKKMALGEYMPQLAVGAQGMFLDIADNQNTYGFLFVTVSVPITNWWEGSHKIKEHKIQIDIAENNRDEKSELLKLQMEKAYNSLIESYKQIDVAQSSLEQSAEHLNVINHNFEAGVLGTSDLLEAQAIYQQANNGLTDAKTNYKINLIKYKQAIANL